MINQLLIHLIIILFPIFIQQFFYARKKITDRIRYQVLNGLMFGASAILCIASPIHVVGSFQWDLRSIPLIISIIYSSGKFVPGILAVAVAMLYRIYIGGDATFFSAISILLFVVPSFFFVKPFPSYLSTKRIVISLLLAANSVLGVFIMLIIYIQANHYGIEYQKNGMILFSIMAVVSIIGMGISALLNEQIIERSLLNLELERSEKLKIVSQIAASVAHEVRNPLTVVKGFLQLLKESVDDKKKDYLKIALSELERAEYIITDYLNLAKPQADLLEIVDVPVFLSNNLEIMNSYGLIQNVQMHFNCNQTNLFIWADKPKLSQVILNLIKNGVEAVPKSGEVTVNAYYRDENIFIEIIDTGKGMSKEELDSIGTPFFTTKATGTGLGIIVTIRIVEAMNGKITFESELDKGTKVIIRLPAAQPDHGS